MATLKLWGSIAANGGISTSSGGFTVSNPSAGIYVIHFSPSFTSVPSVIVTQTNYGNTNESNTDGATVPLVSSYSATIITGDGGGNKTNRAFSFVAIGAAARPLTSFEVLAQPIAPNAKDIPYVEQGFFTQITNMDPTQAVVNLLFDSSPPFVAGNGPISLFTNMVDQTGAVTQYPVATFLEAPVGFKSIAVPAGDTVLLGVQYLLFPGPKKPATLTQATGGTPQNSQAARGMVSLYSAPGSSLMVLSTVRQDFTNYTADSTNTNVVILDVSESAYAVPLAGGPVVSF
jgi:hypothetical protein